MNDDLQINRVDATHLDDVMLHESETEYLDLELNDWEDDYEEPQDVRTRAFQAQDHPAGPLSTSPSSWQQGPTCPHNPKHSR